MVTPCCWEPPCALESLPDPTPSPSSGFPSAVDIRYTQGKKGAKSENTRREASQGRRRSPTATPPCRETGDIRYTKEKRAQKVRTPLRPQRKPPRACGGSQQRHPSSRLPSRSHQTNCEGSHVDNPGVRKGPKRGYKRGWVQSFEGTPETGGARGSGWKLPIRQIGANENIHALQSQSGPLCALAYLRCLVRIRRQGSSGTGAYRVRGAV